MAVAVKPTVAGTCLGCGELVAVDVSFCPSCGTRQVPDRPMPATVTVADTARLERSANAWIVVALAAGALLLLALGILVGGVSASVSGDAGDGAAAPEATDAAATMGTYAPIAEAWVDKHDHVADEATGDDPNGLATAATDAQVWIDVNRADLGALAAGADAGSAPLYQQLVGIFDERSVVLSDLAAIETDSGVGAGAAADELAALDALDQRADAITCEIADVMRAEGDDPDEHITPEMSVDC